MRKEKNQNLIFRTFFSVLFVTLVYQSAFSQNIVGKWKTIDDESGQEKSIVQIWKAEDGMYYGKIIKIFDPQKQESVCDKCDKEDPRFNQKVLGMKIIQGMKKTGNNQWTDGTILDPNNGKVYKCKLFTEGKNLMVRGYIAFLYRTQTWLPVE
ncbi:MAG: DUF2147 domain-containing protein [Bacteroidales bacterium]